jgi:hypothetical protein
VSSQLIIYSHKFICPWLGNCRLPSTDSSSGGDHLPLLYDSLRGGLPFKSPPLCCRCSDCTRLIPSSFYAYNGLQRSGGMYIHWDEHEFVVASGHNSVPRYPGYSRSIRVARRRLILHTTGVLVVQEPLYSFVSGCGDHSNESK